MIDWCLTPTLAVFQLYRGVYYKEEFEDTKGIIRIRKSKKDRQHNGQKKKDKWTNNDLQSTTHKTKNRGTRSPLINGDGPRCSGWVSSSSSTSGTLRINLVTNQVIHDERTWKCLRRSVTYPWSFVTQIFHKTFEVMTST